MQLSARFEIDTSLLLLNVIHFISLTNVSWLFIYLHLFIQSVYESVRCRVFIEIEDVRPSSLQYWRHLQFSMQKRIRR